MKNGQQPHLHTWLQDAKSCQRPQTKKILTKRSSSRQHGLKLSLKTTINKWSQKNNIFWWTLIHCFGSYWLGIWGDEAWFFFTFYLQAVHVASPLEDLKNLQIFAALMFSHFNCSTPKSQKSPQTKNDGIFHLTRLIKKGLLQDQLSFPTAHEAN